MDNPFEKANPVRQDGTLTLPSIMNEHFNNSSMNGGAFLRVNDKERG